MFRFQQALLIVCLALPFSLAIKYRACSSEDGKLTNLMIAGCENADRCPLPKGKNVSASVTFTPSVDVTSLHAQVYGILGPVNTSFPLPNPDGCKNSNLTCPLSSGKSYVYTNAVYVNPIYPAVQVTVQWELFDQNNKRVFCMLVPCQVVKSDEEPVKPIEPVKQFAFKRHQRRFSLSERLMSVYRMNN